MPQQREPAHSSRGGLGESEEINSPRNTKGSFQIKTSSLPFGPLATRWNLEIAGLRLHLKLVSPTTKALWVSREEQMDFCFSRTRIGVFNVWATLSSAFHTNLQRKKRCGWAGAVLLRTPPAAAYRCTPAADLEQNTQKTQGTHTNKHGLKITRN